MPNSLEFDTVRGVNALIVDKSKLWITIVDKPQIVDNYWHDN